MGQLAHTLAIGWVNSSDDGSRKKIGRLAMESPDFLNWWHFGLCKLNISKIKIMEAMLMNGKEKHEVF